MSTFRIITSRLTPYPRLALVAVLLGLSLAAVGPRVRAENVTQSSALAPTNERIEAAVKSYLEQWLPLADPFVTLENGVQMKSSNFYGVELEGERYYYRPRHQFSADPVSRGDARDYQVVLVLYANTDFETEVYRLPR